MNHAFGDHEASTGEMARYAASKHCDEVAPGSHVSAQSAAETSPTQNTFDAAVLIVRHRSLRLQTPADRERSEVTLKGTGVS